MSGKPKATWGGARPGAGRPRLTPRTLDHPSLTGKSDPLDWLQAVLDLPEAGTRLRLEAAKTLLLYRARRPG